MMEEIIERSQEEKEVWQIINSLLRECLPNERVFTLKAQIAKLEANLLSPQDYRELLTKIEPKVEPEHVSSILATLEILIANAKQIKSNRDSLFELLPLHQKKIEEIVTLLKLRRSEAHLIQEVEALSSLSFLKSHSSSLPQDPELEALSQTLKQILESYD